MTGIPNVSVPLESLVVVLIALAAFIIISRKVVSAVFNMIWIAAVSAIFPFAMRLFGADFPTDISSVIFFVTVGVGLYAAYTVGKIIYTLLGFAEKAGRAAAYPITAMNKSREEKMKKDMEKFMKEKEK